MKKQIISLVVYMATTLPLGGVGGGLLSSCSSDDDFTGDPAKDWAGWSDLW